METFEWKWKTNDGLEIYSRTWLPAGTVKGVVCLVHGVGDHIGRYEADAEALTGAGYILAGFDLRGFGKSEGIRGHTPSLEMYLEDIDLFLAEITHRYPNKPCFLYGHSMGGLLVLDFVSVRKPAISGVIATGPGLKTAIETQKIKVFLAKVLGNMFPTLSMDSGLDTHLISRDSAVVENAINDPLVHRKVTASWGKSMLEAVRIALENASTFPSPLFLMHGTEDKIAFPDGSQKFANLAPKDIVTLKMWDGFKHELHTEPEKAEVFQVMIDWLNENLQKSSK
jgi:alpha-beta hydrolase superfamily lysophospholipase